MTQYIVQAPDGSKHIIEGPDQSQGSDQGALMAGGEHLLDMATFGLAKPAEAAVGAVVHGIPYSQARANLEANQAATTQAHPAASMVGDIAGFGASIPVGGEVVEGARAIPAIAKAANAVKAAPVSARIPATIAADMATGAAFGGVQGASENGVEGAKEGAEAGAVAGPLARPVAAALASPVSSALRIIAKSVKLPNETLEQAGVRLQSAADEFHAAGFKPSISEIVDRANSAEIAHTIANRASATKTAQDLNEAAALRRPGEVSAALSSGGPVAAETASKASASDKLTATLTPIRSDAVTPTQQQSQFLADNAADISAKLRGPGYTQSRIELENHLDHGTPLTVGGVENMRRAMASASKSTDPNAFAYRDLKAGVEGIGRNHGGYAAAMDEYKPAMREASNLEAGAKGLTAAPIDYAANRAHPENTPAPLVPAAQTGQTVGLRTALQQTALKSPEAAAGLAADIARNPALQQNIRTALPAGEAPQVQRAGELANRAAEGINAATPRLKTQAQERAETTGEVVRGATLGAHGGSSSFVAHNLMSWLHGVGLPFGTSKKVAELAMDPENTPAVLQYLRARGTTPVQRHEFMNLVRSGMVPAAGGAAGKIAQ